MVTSDRDSFALIDEHTRMLRILNGGVDASPLLDPERLATVTGVRPEQYLDLAALRGDASDNLPGVPGFGAKTAARLLAALGSARAAFDDAADGGERCRAVVGTARTRTLATPEARARWELNCDVMTMVDTVDLGLDLDAGCGTLPLDEAAIQTTYARFGLHLPAPCGRSRSASRDRGPTRPSPRGSVGRPGSASRRWSAQRRWRSARCRRRCSDPQRLRHRPR